VDLIRNNAMNYNQEMIKKIRKSTKDLVDSSPDSVGPSSKANKNSPKYLNMKDNVFNRTVRSSQNMKPKRGDHSHETHSTDKEVRNSVNNNNKSKSRQTFFKDKQQIDMRKIKDPLGERELNGSASQSPRTYLPISNSKAALYTTNNTNLQQIVGINNNNASSINQNTSRNALKSEAKSRSQSKNNLSNKNHSNKFSTNDIHQ